MRINPAYIAPLRLNAYFLLAIIITFGVAILIGLLGLQGLGSLLVLVALAGSISVAIVLTNLVLSIVKLAQRQPKLVLLHLVALVLQLLILYGIRHLILAIPVGKLEAGG
ncbi:hypothetical protein [Hymenobacter swuensis]|uniref:hypothetical protein n=1 Tax=Hymenobacter swuensis TaxID=1446467 RepID=UPI0005C44885|nr:hypothetical protein [Hymenobacter swuensis]